MYHNLCGHSSDSFTVSKYLMFQILLYYVSLEMFSMCLLICTGFPEVNCWVMGNKFNILRENHPKDWASTQVYQQWV